MAIAVETLTIVVGSDSFKGSLTAQEATRAMYDGVRSALGGSAEIIELPLADGGEGTLDVLQQVWGGSIRTVQVFDAIGRPRVARYGLNADRTVAILEAAEANGLPWVADEPLQPLRADSYCVGLIAMDAIKQGASEVLLCVGGSASTDGGTGFMKALGARFLDAHGDEVPLGGGNLGDICAVDLEDLNPDAKRVVWKIAVDVKNPLLGPSGAAAVFGPQKGATLAEIDALEQGLASLVRVVTKDCPAGEVIAADEPGLGAAGGLSYAPAVYLGAKMIPGSRLVSEAIGLPAVLEKADLVITGEGSLDWQSLNGKVVDLVRRSAPAGTPVVVIAGQVRLSAEECKDNGLTAAFSIAPGPRSTEELIENAAELVEDSAGHVAALFASHLPDTRRAIRQPGWTQEQHEGSEAANSHEFRVQSAH